MSLFKKLSNVQKVLKAPKNQFNAFGKYNYRSCEDILEASKPLCIENGLVLTISDIMKQVGSHNYIEATATVIDIESGDKHSVTAFARESETKKGMDDSQITGSTSSYARKYALNGLFCIDDTKDADATNDHGKTQQSKPTQQPDKISTGQLVELAKEKGFDEAALLSKYTKETSKTCTEVKFIPAEFKKKYYDQLQKVKK